MKKFVIIPMLFLFASCGGNKAAETAEQPVDAKSDAAQVKKQDTSGSVEDKIMAVVLELPEVQDANRNIDSVTKHKSGVATMIDPPEPGEQDYSVRVGYNGDERFEVYYFLYVNPGTLGVKIQDLVTDSIVPIEYWRKQNKNK